MALTPSPSDSTEVTDHTVTCGERRSEAVPQHGPTFEVTGTSGLRVQSDTNHGYCSVATRRWLALKVDGRRCQGRGAARGETAAEFAGALDLAPGQAVKLYSASEQADGESD